MTQSDQNQGQFEGATPRPWSAARRQGSWELVIYATKGPYTEICQLFHDDRGNEIGDANAALICAAVNAFSAREAGDWREELAIRSAQYDERWRMRIRELRELAIETKAKAIERRCFDLIMFGPEVASPPASGEAASNSSSENETDNRSAGRKPDKSPSRAAVVGDALPMSEDDHSETAATNSSSDGSACGNSSQASLQHNVDRQPGPSEANSLIERLRARAVGKAADGTICISMDTLFAEAASELSRLTSSHAALVRGLEPFAEAAKHFDKFRDARPLWAALDVTFAIRDSVGLNVGHLREAAALLAQEAK